MNRLDTRVKNIPQNLCVPISMFDELKGRFWGEHH
jgi:hypothetical protein